MLGPEAARKDRKRRSRTPRLHCHASDESSWSRTPSHCSDEPTQAGGIGESDESLNNRLRALSPLRNVRAKREILQVKSEIDDAAQAAESRHTGSASSSACAVAVAVGPGCGDASSSGTTWTSPKVEMPWPADLQVSAPDGA